MARRDENRKHREQVVIQAAARAIADLGFANVRVSDIAERADMTPGHVTYYFPAKAELLMRAIRESEAELVEQAESELATIEDGWERLKRLIELSAATGRGDPGWILWFQVWVEAALDDTVSAVHHELDARWRRILVEVLHYGRARGEFRIRDVDEAALLISAMIDGLSIQLAVGAPGVDRHRVVQLALRSAASIFDSA